MVKTNHLNFNGSLGNLPALFLKQCGSWDRQWHRNASLKQVFNHSVTLLEWVEMICPHPKFRSHRFPTNGQKCEICKLGTKLKHVTSQHCPAKTPDSSFLNSTSSLKWNSEQSPMECSSELHLSYLMGGISHGCSLIDRFDVVCYSEYV